jgi:Rifampin ADP-ribosyl transferase
MSDALSLEEHTVNKRDYTKGTKTVAEAIAESNVTDFVSVTFARYEHVEGPFFHGTNIAFAVDDELAPGHLSNYHRGRTSNHVYFSALIEPAVWAAELAAALSQSHEQERVFVVEPTGPFEDDPNVTNKKFPGNVTQSYRTRHAQCASSTSYKPGRGIAPRDFRRCSTTSLASGNKGLTSSRTKWPSGA